MLVAKRAEEFVEKYFKKTQKALSNQAEKRRKRTSICPYRSWTRGAILAAPFQNED